MFRSAACCLARSYDCSSACSSASSGFVVACAPCADFGAQLSYGSSAPVFSLFHSILREDLLISGSCVDPVLGYSMLLGGILRTLDFVYSEVNILFGNCICACASHGLVHGWRLCSCAECALDLGARKFDAFALPVLAGLQVICCPMSSEHLYDIVYEHSHETYEGACVGSFMWAACFAGLVHSSLSLLYEASRSCSFSSVIFAVNVDNVNARLERRGPPSVEGYDCDVIVSEHLPFPDLDADYLSSDDGGLDNCAFTFDDPDPIPCLVDVISDACSSSSGGHDCSELSECGSDDVPLPPLIDDYDSPPSPSLVIRVSHI